MDKTRLGTKLGTKLGTRLWTRLGTRIVTRIGTTLGTKLEPLPTREKHELNKIACVPDKPFPPALEEST
jgi:hypothetical protein